MKEVEQWLWLILFEVTHHKDYFQQQSEKQGKKLLFTVIIIIILNWKSKAGMRQWILGQNLILPGVEKERTAQEGLIA